MKPWRDLRNRWRRAVKAFFEGADYNTRKWRSTADARSADAQLHEAQYYLVDRARNADNNNDTATSILNELVNKTIGSGLRPEPKIKLRDGSPATEINRRVGEFWERWAQNPMANGRGHYFDNQRLAALSWYRDGEVFCRRLPGTVWGLSHSYPEVPLSLQLVETDGCPIHYVDEAAQIVQGIKQNAWQAATTYYFVPLKPRFDRASTIRSWTEQDLIAVSARNVSHLATRRRVNQTRGVTTLHSILERLNDVKEIDQTERMAARVAAAMCGVVKRGMPGDFIEKEREDKQREVEFVPGMILDFLEQGEDVSILKSDRPNPDLVGFRDAQVRSAAGGAGTGYSAVARKWDGSYSSQRQELVEAMANFRVLTNLFLHAFERPNYAVVANFAVMELTARERASIDPATITDADYSMPGVPWIDPMKEIQADILALTGGEYGIPLASWAATVRRRGGNPDQLLQQIESERELRARLGGNDNAQESTPENPATASNIRLVSD